MPLRIVRNDITKMSVDAIVNAANKTLLGGGGVDGAIHRAAGPALRVACALLGGCKTGEAKVTQGFRLPCKYVIHTVGPVWKGGGQGEKEMLAACYRNALELAQQHGCESVAFPLISAGAYGYPKDQALQVAMDTVTGFLQKQEMEVYLVVFDRDSFRISEKLFSDIASYIDERYVQLHEDHANRRMYRAQAAKAAWDESEAIPMPCAVRDSCSLEDALKQMDESFSQMLLRKIDERGMKDSQCYKRANIDRKLFSKIRSDRHYKPSKPTVLAFAIALELSLEETGDMLRKAGFALSHSNKFDIIVEYFIGRGIYDIHMINEALFAFDQSLLGA